MGIEGARYSDQVGTFADELTEELGALGDLSWRKMFGGAGIFIDGSMFALINSDAELHLKVDDTNRAQFEAAGSEKHARMPYFAVPAEVLEESGRLLEWARGSADIVKN